MNFNERIQPKKITERKEDELDIILREYNSRDGSLQEYLEKLKGGDEEDVQKYYRILEKLAERESKNQMNDAIIHKQTPVKNKEGTTIKKENDNGDDEYEFPWQKIHNA